MKKGNKSQVSQRVITERTAIWAAFATGLTSFILAFIYFMDQTTPLFGRHSIGLTTALLAAIVTLIMFIISWTLPDTVKARTKVRKTVHTVTYWIKRASIAFVHAGLVFLLLSGLFYLLANAFKGVELNTLASSVIVALSVAMVSYAVYPLIAKLTLANLSVILAVFLVAGVLTSAMTMQDPYWWQFHFSSLGAGNPAAALTFNITLIVAGIVIVAITELMTDQLQAIAKEKAYNADKGIATVRGLLIATGIGLSFVGLFPYDTHLTIHNLAASGMVSLFLALIIGFKKFIPFFDPTFYAVSFSMLAAIVVTIVLFGQGIFNLTTLEMVAAGVIFSWFIVFIRQIASLHPDAEVNY